MPLEEPSMEPTGMGTGLNGEDSMTDPMGDETEMNGQSDSEIDNIFSKLDTEKQAAVIKYAKSMVGDDETAVDEPVDEETIVTEITNNILDDRKDDTEREDDKVRNNKITQSNPFMTKSFNTK